MPLRRAMQGFSLIELVIAVVIMGLLASIAIPYYNQYIVKSQLTAVQSDLIALSLNAENYYQRKLEYPTQAQVTNSTTATQALFPNWAPSKASEYFTYTYQWLSLNPAEPYKIIATGKSETQFENCTIKLKTKSEDNNNLSTLRTVENCPSGNGTW